jgi:hypothetical protein
MAGFEAITEARIGWDCKRKRRSLAGDRGGKAPGELIVILVSA